MLYFIFESDLIIANKHRKVLIFYRLTPESILKLIDLEFTELEMSYHNIHILYANIKLLKINHTGKKIIVFNRRELNKSQYVESMLSNINTLLDYFQGVTSLQFNNISLIHHRKLMFNEILFSDDGKMSQNQNLGRIENLVGSYHDRDEFKNFEVIIKRTNIPVIIKTNEGFTKIIANKINLSDLSRSIIQVGNYLVFNLSYTEYDIEINKNSKPENIHDDQMIELFKDFHFEIDGKLDGFGAFILPIQTKIIKYPSHIGKVKHTITNCRDIYNIEYEGTFMPVKGLNDIRPNSIVEYTFKECDLNLQSSYTKLKQLGLGDSETTQANYNLFKISFSLRITNPQVIAHLVEVGKYNRHLNELKMNLDSNKSVCKILSALNDNYDIKRLRLSSPDIPTHSLNRLIHQFTSTHIGLDFIISSSYSRETETQCP